ncbi:hypothetical protein [Streptomyces chryseus]|uniref:hypothetical protein n=1 Tax=Streptomyces chryseus TaxID=68186 RepID=UPI00167B54E2|nr:hypothetical protein [Streptomyces chryseus]GGX45636.1 hypothetical protein GCM10010353_70510 [Streptomyces chryseus]
MDNGTWAALPVTEQEWSAGREGAGIMCYFLPPGGARTGCATTRVSGGAYMG